MNKQEQFEKINELEEKNKLLTETLLQSEERIKKLGEEIELLKNDEKINELEEKNKLLTNTLLQVDNNIKKLEEEIELLKIKKIKIKIRKK
jgi:small-conductance mechanosensitive channel